GNSPVLIRKCTCSTNCWNTGTADLVSSLSFMAGVRLLYHRHDTASQSRWVRRSATAVIGLRQCGGNVALRGFVDRNTRYFLDGGNVDDADIVAVAIGGIGVFAIGAEGDPVG